MKDKYLYMKSKNKCLPYLELVDGQYKFIGAFKDPVRKGYLKEKEVKTKKSNQIILPIASILDERYQVNEEGIIEERHPYCQHCNSTSYIRKGYNWRTLCFRERYFD